MQRLYALIVLPTLFASCIASCCTELNEQPNRYLCRGLIDLNLQIPETAVSITIRNSSISKIPTDAFSVFGASLRELDLSECGVMEIEPDAFRNLTKLEVLILFKNKIRKIDASWIRGLSKLEFLNVWNNRIVEIDPEVYDLLPELETLDVAHNNLNTCLQPENLRKLKNLKKILIGSNPWAYRCRASMTWYLGRNHIKFIKDWSISDLLVEECLAHELGADKNDTILENCIDRKISTSDTLPFDVGSLNEQVRNLWTRVTELEADVSALKKVGQ